MHVFADSSGKICKLFNIKCGLNVFLCLKSRLKRDALYIWKQTWIRKEFAHGDNTDKNKILMVKLFIV